VSPPRLRRSPKLDASGDSRGQETSFAVPATNITAIAPMARLFGVTRFASQRHVPIMFYPRLLVDRLEGANPAAHNATLQRSFLAIHFKVRPPVDASHMSDPINTAAGAVTIVDRCVAAVRWVIRWSRRTRSSGSSPDTGPRNFELCPISFMIDLTQTVPNVEARFYAINYLDRKLILSAAPAMRLYLSTGPSLDPIPLVQEFQLAPKSSFMVFYRRNLLDSEARAISQEKRPYPLTASFSMIARAKSGRREYTYGPVSSMWIEGWINKPPAA